MGSRVTGVSAYEMIAVKLRQQIEDGKWPAGTLIQSSGELAAEYGVSRQTVGAAVELLRQQGLARPVRGVGVFVADPVETVPIGLLLDYIRGRVAAGDVVMFRDPDGEVTVIDVDLGK